MAERADNPTPELGPSNVCHRSVDDVSKVRRQIISAYRAVMSGSDDLELSLLWLTDWLEEEERVISGHIMDEVVAVIRASKTPCSFDYLAKHPQLSRHSLFILTMSLGGAKASGQIKSTKTGRYKAV